MRNGATYIASSEVTTLKHELWNDTVEARASISESLITSAEGTEVLNGPWNNFIKEIEVDPSGFGCEETKLADRGLRACEAGRRVSRQYCLWQFARGIATKDISIMGKKRFYPR